MFYISISAAFKCLYFAYASIARLNMRLFLTFSLTEKNQRGYALNGIFALEDQYFDYEYNNN